MRTPNPDPGRLSASELKRWLDRGDPLVVLDVREDDERAFCAIPTPPQAIDLQIPLGQLAARSAEVARAADAWPVVVYCHLGMRSLVAARLLLARGIGLVFNLDGGIDDWSATVDPNVPRY
jgi:rhodanese-related sulfurtransferase